MVGTAGVVSVDHRILMEFCNQAVEKRTSLAFFCCTADSTTDTGRHQLYDKGSLVLFFPLLDCITVQGKSQEIPLGNIG